MYRFVPLIAGIAAFASTHNALAKEYYVGGPIHQHDMEIVANYLIGVDMAPMTPNMVMGGPDVIHIEADVHATADNVYGFPDGAWVPYLTVAYTIEKLDSNWKLNGMLQPMIAKDGPHYADNLKMNGPGRYKLTYRFTPPEAKGFFRHTDKQTGVPPWWQPFSQEFTFSYPQK